MTLTKGEKLLNEEGTTFYEVLEYSFVTCDNKTGEPIFQVRLKEVSK